MEQLKLENGNLYDLVPGGVLEQTNDKIQITIISGINTFSEIEAAFDNEINTQRLRVINAFGENMIVKNDYTHLESITKQNDYVIGSEEYLDDNGETSYRDLTSTVFVIVLSKPDLHAQVKNLKETVDILVLEGLEA